MNIQQPTSNIEHPMSARLQAHWMLDIVQKFMKSCIILTALSVVLVSCSRMSSDTVIRNGLTGTWRFVQGSPNKTSVQNVFTFAPNGDFTNALILPNGTHSLEVSGTWQVQNGYLTRTVRQSTEKGRHLPYVLRAKIVKVGDKRIVITSTDGTGKQFTIAKDTH